MTGMNNERNPAIESVYLGSQASAASVVVPGIYFRKRTRIKNVYVVDQLGVTLLSTDYFTLTLQDNSPTPIAYATFNTSATTLVAVTQSPPFTLQAGGGSGDDIDSATQPEVDVPAGTMLNCKIVGTHSAANRVLTNAVLLIESYPL